MNVSDTNMEWIDAEKAEDIPVKKLYYKYWSICSVSSLEL